MLKSLLSREHVCLPRKKVGVGLTTVAACLTLAACSSTGAPQTGAKSTTRATPKVVAAATVPPASIAPSTPSLGQQMYGWFHVVRPYLTALGPKLDKVNLVEDQVAAGISHAHPACAELSRAHAWFSAHKPPAAAHIVNRNWGALTYDLRSAAGGCADNRGTEVVGAIGSFLDDFRQFSSAVDADLGSD